jgi:hypothetical protein
MRHELERIFSECRLVRTAGMLQDLGLLQIIHPEFRAGRRCLELMDRLDESIAWYRLQEEGETVSNWVMALCVLAESLDEDSRSRLWTRLSPGKLDLRVLRGGLGEVHRLAYRLGSPETANASDIYHACNGLPLETMLLGMVFSEREEVRKRIVRYISELRGKTLKISGTDLIAEGIPQGPAIARGIASAMGAMLDGQAPDRRTQLKIALRAARSA